MVSQSIVPRMSEGEPTAWVNSLVCQKKEKEKPNGKLRICLDPKELNKDIQRVPTLEEIRFQG